MLIVEDWDIVFTISLQIIFVHYQTVILQSLKEVATQKKCEELREKLTNAEYKATSMTRERDIYKNLYEQILDKVIP